MAVASCLYSASLALAPQAAIIIIIVIIIYPRQVFPREEKIMIKERKVLIL